MYVEGDKGTGRFITSLGVYVCWVIPTKRVLVEREVCKDPRGCELLNGGHCPDCVIESVWE